MFCEMRAAPLRTMAPLRYGMSRQPLHRNKLAVMHHVPMLESTARRSLTLGARLVLDRLDIENARHLGNRNGKLIVTYDQFLAHMRWTRRGSVAAAIQLAAHLPPEAPVPRLRRSFDDGPERWVVLAFNAVDERMPALPWDEAELGLVLTVVDGLAETLTPSPVPEKVVAPRRRDWALRQRYWTNLRNDRPPALDAWSRRHLGTLVALEADFAECVGLDLVCLAPPVRCRADRGPKRCSRGALSGAQRVRTRCGRPCRGSPGPHRDATAAPGAGGGRDAAAVPGRPAPNSVENCECTKSRHSRPAWD
jgi:hypothetical protein